MIFYNLFKRYNKSLIEFLNLIYIKEEIKVVNKRGIESNEDIIEISHEKKGFINVLLKINYTVVDNELFTYKNIDRKDKIYFEREFKILIKTSLYKILSKNKKVSLPWGILTGIRPGIIVHKMLDKGFGKSEIVLSLRNKYFLNSDKSKLLYKIAINEREIIKNTKENEVGIYISIPFCESRCLYCSFVSQLTNKDDTIIERYLETLKKEIISITRLLKNKNYIIQSIYVGGGTPSILSEELLIRFFTYIHENFDLKNVKEFTFEAGRPDSISEKKLAVLLANKVNRISINPQTFNDNILKDIGRNHSSIDIIKKYNLARKMGFDNINMDIIIGLPNENFQLFKNTVSCVKKLKPDSLTIHQLSIKRTSKLKEKFNYLFFDFEVANKMSEYVYKKAEEMNMIPYYLYRQKNSTGNLENVGYSRIDKKCIYNVQMIEDNQSIIGIGAGASTKICIKKTNCIIEKIYNLKNVNEYINRIDEIIIKKEIFLKKL